MRGRIELQVGQCQDRRPCQVGAAEQRSDPREQLFEGERLGEVVVAAAVEAQHAIRQRVARRKHQDRRRDPAAPELAADAQAVPPRQQPVEDDDVIRRVGSQFLPDVPRRSHVDDETLLMQSAREDAGSLRVVLDQQQSHARPLVGYHCAGADERLMNGPARAHYLSKTRVPLIFWPAITPRARLMSHRDRPSLKDS